jgi:hypothetical protein
LTEVILGALAIAFMFAFPVVMAAIDIRWLTGRWPWRW